MVVGWEEDVLLVEIRGLILCPLHDPPPEEYDSRQY
jgi:hypothetical protein